MRASLPGLFGALVALAAIASLTLLVLYGKVAGDAAVALLSTIVGGGLLHVGATSRAASAKGNE